MLKNLFSSSGLSLIRAVVQLFMTLVLTRLIDSSSYGVMAFAIPVWTFITLMSEMGLGNAIIRSEKLSAVEAGAAFKISLFSGVLGAVLMALAAYPASLMLDDPRITGVLGVFSLVLLVAMLSTVPRALLERDLRYSTIALIEISATLAAVPVCLALAVLDAGVWSLVIYQLVIQIVRFISFISVSGQGLRFSGSWRAGKPLLVFGGWILAFNVQNFLARNADNILIGIYIGATALGVYALSYQVMILPLLIITWPASNVLLATLSKSRRESQDLPRQYMRALCFLTASLIFPFMTYLVIGTGYPAHAFMGPSWQDVPAMLAWLAPVGAVQSIASYSGAVLTAAGRVRLYFFFGVANTAVYLLVFLVAVQFGLKTFVVSYCMTAMLLALGHIFLIVNSLSWRLRDLLDSLLAGIAASVMGALGYVLVGKIPYGGDLLHWIFQTTTFVILALAAFLLFRSRIAAEARFLMEHRGRNDGVPDTEDYVGAEA
jgi:O-antigen/teichoic acid export membrane protein